MSVRLKALQGIFVYVITKKSMYIYLYINIYIDIHRYICTVRTVYWCMQTLFVSVVVECLCRGRTMNAWSAAFMLDRVPSTMASFCGLLIQF